MLGNRIREQLDESDYGAIALVFWNPTTWDGVPIGWCYDYRRTS